MLTKENLTIESAVDYLLNKFYLEDSVYGVRDRARESDEDEDTIWWDNNPNGSSWDHPRVLEFSEVCDFLKEFLKTHKNT